MEVAVLKMGTRFAAISTWEVVVRPTVTVVIPQLTVAMDAKVDLATLYLPSQR